MEHGWHGVHFQAQPDEKQRTITLSFGEDKQVQEEETEEVERQEIEAGMVNQEKDVPMQVLEGHRKKVPAQIVRKFNADHVPKHVQEFVTLIFQFHSSSRILRLEEKKANKLRMSGANEDFEPREI